MKIRIKVNPDTGLAICPVCKSDIERYEIVTDYENKEAFMIMIKCDNCEFSVPLDWCEYV